MFATNSDKNYRDPLPGIRQKTLVHGEKTLMVEFRLEGGRTLPDHSHPYEQTGYLVSGRLTLRIGDEIFDTRPGDAWCIPADAVHGAQVLEDAVAIEVFAPVRLDYLPTPEQRAPVKPA
jgi:quercetin dioxygenase-like cupin family protein